MEEDRAICHAFFEAYTVGLLVVVVATGMALMVGCERRSEQTTGKAPPIPKA